jgi:hypothetical protein
MNNFCDDIYNSIFEQMSITPKIFCNIALVNSTFNKLSKKMNITVDIHTRIKCKYYDLCQNKIFVPKNFVMKCQPKCIECLDNLYITIYIGCYSNVKTGLGRCIKCNCIFYNNLMYPICPICNI